MIVDYGMGNLRSVQKAFQRLKVKALVSSSPKVINGASKLVLPGVGHFKAGMQRLTELALAEALTRRVTQERIPILGICLGMQLFTRHSEEGNAEGLAWVDADTVRFSFGSRNGQLRVPHIGWNTVTDRKQSRLLEGIDEADSFYFVHSYHVCSDRDDEVKGRTVYGVEFASVVEKDNIVGVQFHPEKSHSSGLRLLRNFLENY